MPHLDPGLLHELLDGEIPSADLAPIQAHLATCATCRAALDAERRLLADTDEWIELIEVPAITDIQPQRRSVSRRPLAWPRYAAWAATIAIAAGLGYSARRVPTAIVKHDTVTVASTGTANAAVPMAAPLTNQPAPLKTREDRRLATVAPKADSSTTHYRVGVAPALGVTGSLAAPAALADVQARRTDTLLNPGRLSGIDSLVQRPVPTASATAAEMRTIGTVGLGGGRGGRGVARTDLQTQKTATASVAVPVDTITFTEAVQRLGGTLRLIEGMVPLRLEARGESVRVVYATTLGNLLLQQQLIDGRIVFDLVAPRGFPADSLQRLRARVRE